jgi:hypothetical protein
MPTQPLSQLLKVISQRTEDILMELEQTSYYGVNLNFDVDNIATFVNLFNPTLCFSFKNLTGDSSTKILRIRRASDNLEGDVYADTSGVVSPTSNVITAQSTITLQTFAGSANCFVTKWYNQAKNVDGTRNTNDLFSTVTAQQPKMWDGATGLLKSFSANTPELRDMGTGFNTVLNLTENVYTFNNNESTFSLIIVSSGTAGITDNMLGGGTNSFLGVTSPTRFYLDQKIRYDFDTIATISQQVTSIIPAARTIGSYARNNQILEFYEEPNTASSTGRRLHIYGNQDYAYVDTAGKSKFRPNNSTGFRALPGGWIQSNGIRTDEGLNAYFLADYSAIINGFYAFMTVKDSAIGTNNGDLLSIGSTTKTTGAPIRLVATTAPTSNPVIDGVTYTYLTITSIGVTYYILTTNLSSSVYPNGSSITTVTTNAQWSSNASGGIRRVYESIYGAYYSHTVFENIKAQGGYSAGGTTWQVLVANTVIGLGVTQTGDYTIGNSAITNVATHIKFMYQLSDAEFTAAGNAGRWTRANDLSPNYTITRLKPFFNSSTNLSTPYLTSGISEFIYFNRSMLSVRSNISDAINNKNLIYSKD